MKVWVNYNDNRWKKYKIDFEKIACMAAGPAYKDSEVSITLTNDDEIHALNRQWRGIDKPTNVLSFELGDPMLLGDIYISLDTVARQAADAKISVAEHTAHMVVHGTLHLMGYDHITDAQATEMESLEIKIMKRLGYKNPYADETTPVCNSEKCCVGSRLISFLEKFKIRKNSVMQYVAMAVLGVAASFGFAPFNMWWLTVIAIGAAYCLMVRAANDCDGVGRLWLRAIPFGATYSVSMFWWTLHSIYVVPELAAQFAIWTLPALLGLALFGAVVFVWPFVFAIRTRVASGARPFVFAGLWTLVLWLREWVCTGFPWNPIANITLPMPIVANSMSLWGALGLTFVVTGLIAAIVEFLRNRKIFLPMIIFIILAVCGGVVGARNIALSNADVANDAIMIRVVQPARSQSDKISYSSRNDRIARAVENVRNLVSLSDGATAPDLIVFPETTYPFAIVSNDTLEMAAQLSRPIIIGATYAPASGVYNSMIVADADGAVRNIYNKSHLVPFGEYSPFGIMPSPANLTAGAGATTITVNTAHGDFTFAPAICYEIVFSDALVPRNATPNAIINITNDTWFGATPGTYQHLDMVRRYAIESGLPVIRANYSGISAFIGANGEIISSLDIGVAGTIDGFVWGAHMTPYRAIGRNGWLIIILVFANVASLLFNKKYR